MQGLSTAAMSDDSHLHIGSNQHTDVKNSLLEFELLCSIRLMLLVSEIKIIGTTSFLNSNTLSKNTDFWFRLLKFRTLS